MREGARDEPGFQMERDALRRMSVPQLGRPATLATRGEDFVYERHDARPVPSRESVGSLLDGDGPLGVFTERDAGDGERGGLLLDAAGIREDYACLSHEAQHFEIALWRQNR